jgi:U1 small nuclear ribonucleoprotein 70kDa
MPGTHLLPPNLLKLFAPRPPLPYSRPLDKDLDRVNPRKVDAIAPLIAQLKEENTQNLMKAGEGEGMEEGEEPVFTLAEETKRQMRREERKKKRTDEFKIAKESCE